MSLNGGPRPLTLASGPFGLTQRIGNRVVKTAGPDFRKQLPWGVPREREVYLSGLEHHAIARLEDHGEDANGRPWIALPFIPGGTVRERLVSSLPPDIGTALRVVRDVATALQAVHEAGFVHRDVHIHNVMIATGTEPRGVLLDFGIAGVLSKLGETTDTGLRTGSPRYAAPEQIVGAAQSTACDVWGLGALMYCLVYRRAPYSDGTARNSAPSFTTPPPPLKQSPSLGIVIATLLKAMLALEARARPTMPDVTGELTRLLGLANAPDPQ